jgi:hypothetical protein
LLKVLLRLQVNNARITNHSRLQVLNDTIISADEKKIPQVIQVLWFAVIIGQDTYKGKNLSEILSFEKHKEKKGHGIGKTISCLLKLDVF